VKCVECGTEFEPNKYNQICCSPRCSAKHKSRVTRDLQTGVRVAKRKRKEPEVPDGRKWGICKRCGKEGRINRLGDCTEWTHRRWLIADRMDGDWKYEF
jgi:DNA-directed RNA polymerase subunit RPC12/RpoP